MLPKKNWIYGKPVMIELTRSGEPVGDALMMVMMSYSTNRYLCKQ